MIEKGGDFECCSQNMKERALIKAVLQKTDGSIW
jgi:hypothetical protein